MLASLATIALGLWLMISPAILRHASNTGLNTFFVGLAVATTGACAIWLRSLRYLNMALGLYLIASALFMGYHSWWLGLHDGVLGALVLFFAGRPGQALRSSLTTDTVGPLDRNYPNLHTRHDHDEELPVAP